ncbi:MAG: hypothetical protein M3326_03705 [Actinomycetota bacterium]|nr:hypothetical protein [Actinomycetota bacterium]
MRRYDTSCALHGQLLFADLQGGTLTLDCFLTVDGRVSASPVTFSARFDERAAQSLDHAIRLLLRWADESAPIEVTLFEGSSGPQIQMTSASKRVVLTTRPSVHGS